MNIIDRYIGKAVLIGSLLAFLVLLSLSAFFAFIEQLGDLKGDYTALKALEYVLFVLPRKGYEIFHTSILLGTLLSLGSLANNSELVVLRAAGMSINRIAWSVMKAGLLLMLAAGILGEVVAPPAENYAQKIRASAISGSQSIRSGSAVWSKNGQNYIKVDKIYPDSRLSGISIFTFDNKFHLQRMISAKNAIYKDDTWQLQAVTETQFNELNFTQKQFAKKQWDGLMQPEMLDTLTVKAQNLSIVSLFKYVQYLQQNQLDSAQYELAFWMKVVKPFSVLVMLLIALPFVFGSLRSTSVGQRLVLGVLLGLGFHLFNQALNHIGVGYGLNPIVSALIPSLVFVMGGMFALKRIF
ncbi:MAG: LPS export ABC transporter permease LptG [Gammaproteobacteria bacterium]|nr:LPS export ABC transporter permease LptG [Gammaproteobacteria bacterium]